jgi:hypothetical protein
VILFGESLQQILSIFSKWKIFLSKKEFSSEFYCRIIGVILFGGSLQQILSIFSKWNIFFIQKKIQVNFIAGLLA